MNKRAAKIPKVQRVPLAFAPLAKAINDLIDNQGDGLAGLLTLPPLRLTAGPDGNAILEIDIPRLIERLSDSPKAKPAGGGGGAGDLEARVASLESRLSGYGARSIFVCITGTLTSITFFTK